MRSINIVVLDINRKEIQKYILSLDNSLVTYWNLPVVINITVKDPILSGSRKKKRGFLRKSLRKETIREENTFFLYIKPCKFCASCPPQPWETRKNRVSIPSGEFPIHNTQFNSNSVTNITDIQMEINLGLGLVL